MWSSRMERECGSCEIAPGGAGLCLAMVSRRHLAFAAALLTLLVCACASAGKSSSSPFEAGSKLLPAVVTERQYDPSGGSASGYRGSGVWYLSFEAQDGDKTVHYRYQVTQQQYMRYPEGSRVILVVQDDDLREIRPGKD